MPMLLTHMTATSKMPLDYEVANMDMTEDNKSEDFHISI